MAEDARGARKDYCKISRGIKITTDYIIGPFRPIFIVLPFFHHFFFLFPLLTLLLSSPPPFFFIRGNKSLRRRKGWSHDIVFVRTVDGENGNKMYAGFVRGLRQIYGQIGRKI